MNLQPCDRHGLLDEGFGAAALTVCISDGHSDDYTESSVMSEVIRVG